MLATDRGRELLSTDIADPAALTTSATSVGLGGLHRTPCVHSSFRNRKSDEGPGLLMFPGAAFLAHRSGSHGLFLVCVQLPGVSEWDTGPLIAGSHYWDFILPLLLVLSQQHWGQGLPVRTWRGGL